MKKIKIFLASSNELENERRQFEIEIYRKTKMWFDKGIFLHLDVWEDLSARLTKKGSQNEYNKLIEEADIFILLAHSKVGMYTAEEFRVAFGQFQILEKPFIYTYFKEIHSDNQDSLDEFKNELETLKHYYSYFTDFHDLWNQFNKELDRLAMRAPNKHFEGEKPNLFNEKNVVRGDIKNVGSIRIGDNITTNSSNYQKKNVFEGNVDGADNFIVGDGH